MVTTILILLIPAFTTVLGESLSLNCDDVQQGGGVCIPIKQCKPIVRDLHKARDAGQTGDKEKMNIIIAKVRNKVCGDKKDKLICCPPEQEVVTQPPPPPPTAAPVAVVPKLIGNFVNIYHDIGGTAYELDSKNILIKGFTYDGEGPDAFFWAGTTEKPNRRGTNKKNAVLPYPFTGQHFDYYSRSIPILGRFNGTKDILLTLPEDIEGSTENIHVQDIRWLSVWCRDYKVNFGHVTFP